MPTVQHTNSLLQLSGAYPQDIYELYNDTLNREQSYVDLIVDSINYAIYVMMNGGYDDSQQAPAGAYQFDYDTTEWIGTHDMLMQSRVTDQVIKYFKTRGIRVYVKNDILLNLNTPLYFDGTYNLQGTNINILTVQWFIRENNEYMKSYV